MEETDYCESISADSQNGLKVIIIAIVFNSLIFFLMLVCYAYLYGRGRILPNWDYHRKMHRLKESFVQVP